MTTGFSRRARAGGALALVFACGVIALDAQSGQKRLTLEDIYDPRTQVGFSGAAPQTDWFDDDTYLVRRRGAGWQKVSVATGQSAPLLDVEAMQKALAAVPGVARDDAAAAARGAYEFNPMHSAILVTIASDLYHYEFGTGRATRLTDVEGEEELATFSPNGQTVAFVRGNNLYTVDVATPRVGALTTHGSHQLFNGKLDFL
jgi:dipeptidyl-peptidase-4